MKTNLKSIFPLIFCLIAVLAHAADRSFPDLEWRNLDVDSKRSPVFCFFADSHGLRWLGAQGGLYFFDGVRAVPCGVPELRDCQVYTIVEQGAKLYVGTNNGLWIYDYVNGKIEAAPAAVPKEIRALMVQRGSLWIGGLEGLVVMDLNSGKVRDVSGGLPHKSVYALAYYPERNQILAGTYKGLAYKGPEDSGWNIDKNSCLNDVFINSLVVNRDAKYIGGDGLVYWGLNKLPNPMAEFKHDIVKSLVAGSGELYVGTHNGLVRYDVHSNKSTRYTHDISNPTSLGNNEIWCVNVDTNAVLGNKAVWAGHAHGFSIADNSVEFKRLNLGKLMQSGESNDIHTMWRDRRGTLWLGGTNGLIAISRDGSKQWFRHSDAPNSLSHNHVRDIMEDSEGRMCFATDGGINILNADGKSFRSYNVQDVAGEHKSEWVYSLVEDGKDLWVGAFLSGLQKVNKADLSASGGTVTSTAAVTADKGSLFHLPNNLINRVVRTADGSLWILLFRDNHLIRYQPRLHKATRYNIEQLAGGYPTRLAVDGRGQVWCAFAGGVMVFNPDGNRRVIKFPATGADESVLAMGAVGDKMWISTQSNVWTVSVANYQLALLALPQGAYSSVFWDKANGEVYLGGSDEVLKVNDKLSSHNLGAINLIIPFKADGSPDLSCVGCMPRDLTIPSGGSLSLLVGSTAYTPMSLPRYMYKLASSATDSIDGWVSMPEGSDVINLSGLSMGKYHLLVKKVGTAEAPVRIFVRVLAPWYLTWWAFIGYFLLLTAVLWACWYYFRSRARRREQEHERRMELENLERKLRETRSSIREQVRMQSIAEANVHPIEAESINEKLLEKIARTVEDNISDADFNVNTLCEKADIPNKQLYRLLKKYMDLTPVDYIRNVRLRKAAALLGQNRFTVSEIAYMVGFKTPSYFTKCFQTQYGVKPSEYRGEG